MHAIQAAIQQAPNVPQPELVNGLVQGFAALINQISFELAKLRGDKAVPVTIVTPTTTPAKEGWTTTEKFIAGGVVGATLAGVGLLLYYAGKRN